jgi:hypothetical protein
MYVLLDEQGAVARYPYSVTDLRRDNPDTSFPVQPSDESLDGFRVYPVAETEPPAASLIERVEYADPVLVDGVWTQQWAVEPLPLAEAKAVLWALAKAKRESITDAPGTMVTTPFGTIQSDATSQRNINGMVTMALIAQGMGAPFSEAFTLADNSVVTLSAPQMIGLGAAVGQHVAAAYARGRALRDAIHTALDHDTLDLIDVDAGWP